MIFFHEYIQVQWDSPFGIQKIPERVSPWNIEITGPAKRKQIPFLSSEKRARTPDPLLPGTPNSAKSGLFMNFHEDYRSPKTNNSTHSFHSLAGPWWSINGHQSSGQRGGVFQGQEEKGNSVVEPILRYTVKLQASHGGPTILELGKQVSYSMYEMFRIPKPNDVKGENNGTTASPNELRKFRLFGIDIVENVTELPSLQVVDPGGLQSTSSSLVHPTSQSSVSNVPGLFQRISLGGPPIVSKSCIKAIFRT